QVLAHPECLEYVRGLEGRRSARRSRGYGDILEPHEQRFTFDERETHIEVSRQPLRRMAVLVDLVELLEEPLAQSLAHLDDAPRFGFHLRAAQLAGFAETYDAGDVERSGTHATLVPAAIHHRGQAYAWTLGAHIQSAAAFGSVYLVPGQ